MFCLRGCSQPFLILQTSWAPLLLALQIRSPVIALLMSWEIYTLKTTIFFISCFYPFHLPSFSSSSYRFLSYLHSSSFLLFVFSLPPSIQPSFHFLFLYHQFQPFILHNLPQPLIFFPPPTYHNFVDEKEGIFKVSSQLHLRRLATHHFWSPNFSRHF